MQNNNEVPAKPDPATFEFKLVYMTWATKGISPETIALTKANPENAEALYRRYESAKKLLRVYAISLTAKPTGIKARVGTIQCRCTAAGGTVQANQVRPIVSIGAAKENPMILSSLLGR